MDKKQAFERRRRRVRAKIIGTAQRPRLSVFASNKHIVAQIIDDTKGNTLAFATDLNIKTAKGNKTDKAKLVGAEVAKQAKAKKVQEVVFDRAGKLYHGRVQALADAAREAGLKF